MAGALDTFDQLAGAPPTPAQQQAAPSVPVPSSPQQEAPAAPGGSALATFDSLSAGNIPNPTSQAQPPTASPAAAPVAQDNSVLANVGQGLVSGVLGLPDLAHNLAADVTNAPIRGINKLFGTNLPLAPPLEPPQFAPAQTESDRMIQGGAGAVGSLIPTMLGGEALKGIQALGDTGQAVGEALSSVPARALPAVAAGGVAGQAAADNVPEPYKNLAYTIGNMLGGAGASTLQEVGASAANSIGNIPQRLAAGNIGPKQSYSAGLPEGVAPIKATTAQAEAATGRVAAAGGKQLVQDLQKDPLSDTEADLAARVATPEGNTPENHEALANVRAAMAQRGSQYETIPGVAPTTAQVSPSPGMSTLEHEAMLSPTSRFGRESFQAQQAQANQALIGHLEGINPGATQALGDAFVQRAIELSAAQEATGKAGAQKIAQASHPLTAGYNENQPQIAGNAMRQGAAEADTQARQNENDLFWSQVPRDLQHSVQPAQQLARTFLGEPMQLPAGADADTLRNAQRVNDFVIRPDLADMTPAARPQEIQTLEAIANLPPTLNYRDTATLLRNISATKANLIASGEGQSPSMVRLRMIEGSLQDSMSGDAQQRMLDGSLPLVPPGTSAEGAAALSNARQAAKARFTQFNQGAVGDVLRGGTDYAPYRIGDLGSVAKSVFNGSINEPERVAQMLGVLRNNPAAIGEMRNYLIYDAAQRGVLNPSTGEINPAKYATWMNGPRLQTVKQFPDLFSTFENAKTAQLAVDNANAGAKQARIAYENGVAKSILGGRDPALVVQQAISANDRGESLLRIYNQVKGDPNALSSLQGHIINEMVNKFAPDSSAAAGAEEGTLASKRFRTWADNFKEPLKRIFGGQGYQRIQQIYAALKDAQAVPPPIKGSQTTPLHLIAKMGGHGGIGGGLGIGVATLLGERGMEGLGGAGLVGAAVAGTLAKLGSDFRAAGISNVNDLTYAMMRYPDFAKVMLQRFPADAQMTPGMVARIGRSLRGVVASEIGLGGQAPVK